MSAQPLHVSGEPPAVGLFAHSILSARDISFFLLLEGGTAAALPTYL